MSTLLLRRRGGELEGVEHASHAATESLVHTLMLADARQATKTLADHARRIMIAVAGEIGDLDGRVGDARADQRRDLVRRHRHDYNDPINWRRASISLASSVARICASSISTLAET